MSSETRFAYPVKQIRKESVFVIECTTILMPVFIRIAFAGDTKSMLVTPNPKAPIGILGYSPLVKAWLRILVDENFSKKTEILVLLLFPTDTLGYSTQLSSQSYISRGNSF
ncbi:MAG: hypothetical protein ACI8R8_002550 [Paraglaciecola sp.]